MPQAQDRDRDLTAREILHRIAHGETTAEAVVKSCLDRIAAREETVAAWDYIDADRALAEARQRDRVGSGGPLHGLPIAIKDNIDTSDMPTSYGSPIYAGHRPAADAACVALLRGAGAIILGKTVSTEFAAFHARKTRNPHNPKHAPGGSSSGSAAAVADGMVPVAIGTQTGGSVIRPAAFCGIVGFKPSFGIISRAGVKPASEGMDTVGTFGRSVGDAALIAGVLMGADPADFERPRQRPPRIAVYRGPDASVATPAAVKALDAAVQRLAAAGAVVTETEGTPSLRAADQAQTVISAFEMARALAPECLTRRSDISTTLVAVLEQGMRTPLKDYLAAVKLAAVARQEMAGAFAETDLWLTYSAAGEAPTENIIGHSGFNRLWSLLHLPLMTLPVARGPQGLPLGVQLIGPPLGDAALVAGARWCEDQLDCRLTPPR